LAPAALPAPLAPAAPPAPLAPPPAPPPPPPPPCANAPEPSVIAATNESAKILARDTSELLPCIELNVMTDSVGLPDVRTDSVGFLGLVRREPHASTQPLILRRLLRRTAVLVQEALGCQTRLRSRRATTPAPWRGGASGAARRFDNDRSRAIALHPRHRLPA